jgi:hypothetical protein
MIRKANLGLVLTNWRKETWKNVNIRQHTINKIMEDYYGQE